MNLGQAATRLDATMSALSQLQATTKRCVIPPASFRSHDLPSGTARGTIDPSARSTVGKREKLIGHARRAPNQLRFRDAVWLAEAHGFHHVRTQGSHTMFKAAAFLRLLNLQNVNGLVPA